jgi:hypothetical protein
MVNISDRQEPLRNIIHEIDIISMRIPFSSLSEDLKWSGLLLYQKPGSNKSNQDISYIYYKIQKNKYSRRFNTLT